MKRLRSLRAAALAAAIAVLATPTVAAAYEGTGDDFMQINQLLVRYTYALDHHDGPGWAAVFTPNGEFHEASYCLIGRAALADVAAHFGGGPGVAPTERHVVQPGPIVFQDKDHATMKNFVMVVKDLKRGETDGALQETGTFDDKLERVNGHWLIANRLEVSPGDGPPKPCPAQATMAAYTPPPAPKGYQGNGDDYAQIFAAIHGYGYFLDHHSGPGWASVFAPNGEFHDQADCLIGSAQIDYLGTHFGEDRKPKPGDPPRPPSSGHLVQIGPVTFLDHDHAVMHNYLLGVSGGTRGKNDGRIATTATYEDRLERVNGRWLIAYRIEHSPGDKEPKDCSVPSKTEPYTPMPAPAYIGTGDDLAQITQLNAVYSYALDNRDAESWPKIYAPGGIFRAAMFCAAGHGQLAALVTKMPAVDPNKPRSRHVGQMGPIFYQDKDHATEHSFVFVVQDMGRDHKSGGVTTSGWYDDKLERVNGKWLIADRLETSPGDGPPMACPPGK